MALQFWLTAHISLLMVAQPLYPSTPAAPLTPAGVSGLELRATSAPRGEETRFFGYGGESNRKRLSEPLTKACQVQMADGEVVYHRVGS